MTKRTMMILSVLVYSTFLKAAISGRDFIDTNNSQLVNLSMQFKGKHKSVKSELSMPFYQTAELEKKIDHKNYFFEINPRKGKKSGEIEIEVKIFSVLGARPIAKKEFVAKLNQETNIAMKGLTLKVTPEI
jgi:hypothetical protein